MTYPEINILHYKWLHLTCYVYQSSQYSSRLDTVTSIYRWSNWGLEGVSSLFVSQTSREHSQAWHQGPRISQCLASDFRMKDRSNNGRVTLNNNLWFSFLLYKWGCYFLITNNIMSLKGEEQAATTAQKAKEFTHHHRWKMCPTPCAALFLIQLSRKCVW